jgi:type IV secretory pathway TraG/TraD family ATPase VirD4
MYPHEIKMLPADQLLILRRNQNPVKAYRITYYKNKIFRTLPAAPVDVPALTVDF